MSRISSRLIRRGAITRVEYSSSIRHYLDDEECPETRWKTSLPFPVQVVQEVTVRDHITGWKNTTSYAYHHGFYDGAEREFRGFGKVEQWDAGRRSRVAYRGGHASGVPGTGAQPEPARRLVLDGALDETSIAVLREVQRGQGAAPLDGEGEAGVLLVKVTVVKSTPSLTFAGVNSGLNHLLRPMMYDAYHEIVNISNPTGSHKLYTIVGYICETDTFGSDRKLNEVREGDILAIKNAGAYGYSMSSNYNSRLRPAEVLLLNGQAKLIREREKLEDLWRNQPEIDL